MNLNDFFGQVPIISKERDYWFVRTETGTYFDSFYENGFIGIGWDKITIEDLVKKDPWIVKQKIAKAYGYGDESYGKKMSTSVYNKLIRFHNLRSGDVVVIPSAGSSRLAFGIVKDQRPYVDNDETGHCEYVKRRKIIWQKQEQFSTLDPIFNKIKTNQHSISNINNYASYIDIVTNSLYYKGDNAHLVLNFRTTNEINAKEFFALGNSLMTVLEAIEAEYNFGEKVYDTTLRLYLQSPGKVALKSISKKSLVMLGLLLLPTVTTTTQTNTTTDAALDRVKSTTSQELNIIHDSLAKMRTNSLDEINDIFNHNN